MKRNIFLNLKPLFILEIANNHNGSLQRGLKIISNLADVVAPYQDIFDFAIKFQYRNIETFIHPDYKERFDLKFVKKYIKTALSEKDYIKLCNYAKENGFLTICTPFDEASVSKIEVHNYDILKIASSSLKDWQLLKRVASSNLPVIASVAGSSLNDIKKALKFLKDRDVALMHCVAQYPLKLENVELNQIDFLKNNFPDIPIGFSTHENPNNIDIIKMAIAKNAVIFEKHVGLDDYKDSINEYSATPMQVEKWLQSAKEAFLICGEMSNNRYIPSSEEKESLKSLSRAVFARKHIKKGEKINNQNTFLAIPFQNSQFFSCDFDENINYIAKCDISKNAPITMLNSQTIND